MLFQCLFLSEVGVDKVAQLKWLVKHTNSSYGDVLRVLLSLQALRVCVTGAAGQIAYSLLYSVAKGDVFGAGQVSCSQLNTREVYRATATRRGSEVSLSFCITTVRC